MFKKYAELGGYLGMFLILASTVPITYDFIMGQTAVIPPISMVLLVDIGLLLYLIRAIAQKDKLYLLANAIGFTLQSLLLYFLIT